ncbi:hypothetical protein EPUS_06115 [Endocarpon pusillum Z07020]|uniref:Peptidase A1 domain-containing protein n=1 Tax=Endocarpon pusillum (strain Z07020 / HMAS-L-300199) TaxID=1263415 RepID=U1HSY7_ENDPU|nr:uncharacterized protein EPUS_06115 [Endocarpon pusillum Z07020]ERF72359.1 hypothetical protein EPUS_06115 [Endocarpon pusillum Z07020]
MASFRFFCIAFFCVIGFIPHYWRAEAACPKPIWLPLSNCTIARANTPTVDSWGTLLAVRSSGQELCLVPSTALNNSILMGVDVCRPDNRPNSTLDQCRSRRGGLLDVAAMGSSFIPIATSSLVPDDGWRMIMAPSQPFQQAGKTTLNLLSDASIEMPVAIVTEGQNHTTSELGLGLSSVFLQSLVDAGLIAARVFGLNAGSQSTAQPREGSLVLGGYDMASISSHFTEYPMDYPLLEDISNRVCPLQVKIRKLILRPADGDDITLSDEGSDIDACIEPYDNLFRLPTFALDLFKQHTQWTSDTTEDPELLVPEPGLLYPSSTGFNGSLLISLNNDFEVEIPNAELQHPLRGIAANGTRVLNNNITEANVYFNSAPLQAAVLGKVFLSQVTLEEQTVLGKVYLAVDYDAKRFKLARQIQRDVTPNPVHLSPCSSNKLGVGSIAAIVIGSVLGLLIALLLWSGWYFRKRLEAIDWKVEHFPHSQNQTQTLPVQPVQPAQVTF